MKRRAFTAVETLLTIGVIAVTAGLSIPMYRNYQIRGDLDIATEQTIQALRRAQLLSQAGEQDSQWGFYVRDGILFQGEQYALRDPNFDEAYPFPPTINTSGLAEVVFSRVYGVPQETGEIILEGLNGDRRIIIVSEDGILTPSTNFGEDFFSDTDDSAIGEIDGGVDGVDSGIDGDSDGSTDSDGGDTGGTDDSTGGDTGGTTGGDDGSDGDTGGGGGGGEPTCEDRFSVASDGSIETSGTVDVTFKVLGSQITYGAGGPEVQVRVYASSDGGNSYTALFGENDVDGGEEQTISNLITGKQVVLKFNARYSWYFNNTFTSNDGTGHVEVLRNGDDPPDYAPFGNQSSLSSFLQNIIDDNGKIDIGEYDAVALAELGSSLNSNSSDFQDAVVLMKFDQQAGACAASNEPKFKVEFDRMENFENGDIEAGVYVGGGPIAFAESQWIPLKNNGTTIVDSGLVEAVPGLASQRGNGFVRILLHGSHPSNGSRELADARIVFDGVDVVNVVNDTGNNATENPFDGVINDGAGGDEVTIAANNKSVLYQTRVTVSDDGIYIYWTDTGDAGSDDGSDVGSDTAGDDGTDAGSSSSSGTDGSADDSASSSAGSDSGDTADGGDGGDDTPDPCGAAYVINENGRIVLSEDADVTFEVLGSYSTYGNQGPEVQVRMNASIDGGLTWASLFGYRDVDGEESQTINDVPSGSEVVLQIEGRYSWLLRSTTSSDDDSGRVRFIRRGGAMPGTTPFANPLQLKRFLRNQIQNGVAAVGKRELLAVVELQDLDNNSDYQDLVIKIIIEKPASQGICGAPGSSGNDDDDDGDIPGDSSCTTTCSTLECSDACGLLSGGICGCIGEDDEESDDENHVICHYPPGNPRQSQTQTVNGSAWVAHRSHGDTLGACEEDRDDDGIVNSEDLCPDTFLPEDVPVTGLMYFKRYALTHNNFAFREGPRKKVSAFTLADTRGCSCGQLVDVAEGDREYRFNQYPRLLRQMRSLFPFYTEGARNNGCGIAIMRMIQESR